MIKRVKGDSNLEMFQKKASTAFTSGMFVTYDAATGFIKPLTNTDADVTGIIQQTIASTDTDYASNTRVAVDQLNDGVVLEIDVSSGTIANTDEGSYFKVDAASTGITTTGKSATRGAGFTAQGLVFQLKKFISTTKGEFIVTSRTNTRPAST